MGLGNREGGKYITILGGRFAIKAKEGEPGVEMRTNKIGNVVWEKFYDHFTAKLVNIRIRESAQYGKNWEFDFRDGGDVYTLQLSYSNSFATNLLKVLPNVNLEEEMKLQPVQKTEDGKTKSSLFVSQNGVTLKHAYTMDNPNGLPPMEKVMVKGQEVWDDSKRLLFLQAMVERDILPQLSKDSVPSSPDTAMAVEELADDSDTEDEDDY